MKKVIFVFCMFCFSAFGFAQKISSIKWENPFVDEGQDAALLIDVAEAEDGEIVLIKIFPQGKNEKNCVPYAVLNVPVKNGKANGIWKYERAAFDQLPKKNPKFAAFAKVGSATAQTKDLVEVKLNRVEIKNIRLLDENQNPVKAAVMGKEMSLVADVLGEVETVTLKVWDVTTGKLENKVELCIDYNKRIELGWIYDWDGYYLEQKPRVVFEIEAPGCAPVKSREIEISMIFKRQVRGPYGEVAVNHPYELMLMNGKKIAGKTDKNGMIIIKNLVPGEVQLSIDDFPRIIGISM